MTQLYHVSVETIENLVWYIRWCSSIVYSNVDENDVEHNNVDENDADENDIDENDVDNYQYRTYKFNRNNFHQDANVEHSSAVYTFSANDSSTPSRRCIALNRPLKRVEDAES